MVGPGKIPTMLNFPGYTKPYQTPSRARSSVGVMIGRYPPLFLALYYRPPRIRLGTGIYEGLDSNVGASIMAFSHTPFPKDNSAGSLERYGAANPTRPYKVIAKYLEDLFIPYLHLVTFNTTFERVEKVGEEWVITLRKLGRKRQDGNEYDYWWTETFGTKISS